VARASGASFFRSFGFRSSFALFSSRPVRRKKHEKVDENPPAIVADFQYENSSQIL
jgi:hypothetical protein